MSKIEEARKEAAELSEYLHDVMSGEYGLTGGYEVAKTAVEYADYLSDLLKHMDSQSMNRGDDGET
jgi:hypothetical protein